MKHKHYECIVAWAEGKEVQVRCEKHDWEDMNTNYPDWYTNYEYRIKPEPKPDIAKNFYINYLGKIPVMDIHSQIYNLILIWDGETGEFKSAEVIK
jgi:hypothetical protein